MALSILILCIVSMTSFNEVASRRTTEQTTTERTTTEQPYSGPLLDFGFSRMLDDLVSANDNSTNRKAILAIFAEVENQLNGSKFKSVSEFIRPEMQIHRLKWYLNTAKSIETQYDLCKSYIIDENSDEDELMTIMLEYSFGDVLTNARHIVFHTDEDTDLNFMKVLIENTKNKSADACSYVKQSRKYEIYEIYHKLVITAVKLFAMRMYTFHLETLDFNKKHEKTAFEGILSAFNNVAVPAIAEASSEMFSCDEAKTGTGKKFIELKWLFNPISINEIYLKEDAPRCWNTCPDYQNATFHQYDPTPDVNQCPGRLYNCFRETVDVCDSSTNYYRRYTEDSHDKNVAERNQEKKSWCTRKNKRPYIENGPFDTCDKCVCYCGDQDRSDIVRRFSLRAVESDTSKNRVITGIQFVEKNQTIYLKIQEGELRPNGTIDESTVQWQPINEIDWTSPFVSEYDYVTITHDLKSVNLDTLVVSTDRVLTGIRWNVQGSHLALMIKSNAFNYSTGILQGEFWQAFSPMPRQEITMNAPDSPFFMDQSVVDTREKTYVTFQKTDYEKDAAQTTVPVIDALPVAPNPAVPLSGVGLYYSGQTGYGGFIGFKAITYDFSKVIFEESKTNEY